MKKILQGAVACILLATIHLQTNFAQAQGTAFTYQGRLNNGTNVATGSYDLRFALFDAVTAGAQQGNLLTNSATAVSNGLFTVTLDFGNQFSGAPRWLEIAVRTNGLTTFTNLAPRQPLTPTPYAMFASGISGVSVQANSSGGPNVALGSTANSITGNIVGATIGGGGATNYAGGGPVSNLVTASFATVSGGAQNAATFLESFVGGGYGNTASGQAATVSGGIGNTASGQFSTVPGGSANVAGGLYSFAAGHLAQALHTGSFVWGDSQLAFFTSTANDQFLIRAAGGVGIGTATPAKQLDVTGNASGVASGASIDPSVFVRVNNSATDGTLSSPDYAGIGFGNSSTRQAIVGGTFGSDYLDFYTGGLLTSPKMRIDFNGNVGIGVTAPSAALTIGTSAAFQLELLKAGNNPGYQFNVEAGGLNICERNIACGRLFIANATGNIGLGTTLPGERLTIAGVPNYNNGLKLTGSGSIGAGMAIESTASGGRKYDLFASGPGAGIGAGGFGIFDDAANAYRFNINSNGYVGIGAAARAAHFHVNGGVFETPVAAGLFEVQNCGAACAVPSWTEGIRLMNTEGNVLGLVGIGFLTAAAGTSLTNVPDVWIGNDDKASGNTHSFKIATQSGGVLTNRVFVNGSSGNFGIGTTTPATKLDVAGEITCTAINITSDRNAKEEFKPVNAREVLAKVVGLPITEWQYKSQADARHIGPMAQDFREAFTLGHDEKHIATVDEGGVALAAIQGLNEKLEEQKAENAELKQTVAELKNIVEKLTRNASFNSGK